MISKRLKLVCLVFILLFKVEGLWSQTLDGKNIFAHEVVSERAEFKKEIESFIKNQGLHVYSGMALSKAIKKMYFEWPIYSINVEAQESPQGFMLKWTVLFRTELNQLKVKGAKAISKKQISKILQFEKQALVVQEDLNLWKEKLIEAYKRKGFLGAQVRVAVETDLKQKNTLIVEVNEGGPCRLASSEVVWVEAKENVSKLPRLNIKPQDVCDEVKINAQTEKWLKKLNNRSYRLARVEEQTLQFTNDSLKGMLKTKVFLGPRLKVLFAGNTFVFERSSVLEEVIGLGSEKDFSSSWINFTALPGLKDFYKSVGFEDPKFHVEDKLSQDLKERKITFRIERGKKSYLNHVEIVGEKGIKEKKLKQKLKLQGLVKTKQNIFVEKEIQIAVDEMMALYQSKGFLQAQVESVEVERFKHHNNVKVHINEGGQTRLKALVFQGNTVFTEKNLLKHFNLKPNAPMDPAYLQDRSDALEELYHSKGFGRAQVQLPPLEQMGAGEVSVLVNIQEGEQTFIGEVHVVGAKTTKERIVNHLIELKPNETLDPNKIRLTRRKLLQSGFFQSVSIEELPSVDHRQDVLVHLKERKKRSLIFRPGYSTDDGVRGAFEFRYNNIAGTGRQLATTARANHRLQNATVFERRLGVSLIDPYVWGTLQGRISFFNERKDEQQFDIDRTSMLIGVEKRFLEHYRANLNWELEFRRPFNELPGAILSPIDQAAARFGSLSFGVDFDFRDHLLNPVKGTFHRLSVDYYNKNLFSEADFYQVFLRNSFYTPIYKRIRAVLALRFGFSSTYGQTRDQGIDDVPIEKRFRLGGATTFRGLGLNCIGGLGAGVAENCSDAVLNQAPGGNSVFNYMFEILLPITRSFDVALFTDGGNAYASNSKFDVLNIRNSAGVGLRLNTFFGPVRLDWGFLLDRRKNLAGQQDEPIGTLHFSVGQF